MTHAASHMKLAAVLAAGAAAVAVPPQAGNAQPLTPNGPGANATGAAAAVVPPQQTPVQPATPTQMALKDGVQRCQKIDACSSGSPFECLEGPLQKLDNGVTSSTTGGCSARAWTAQMCNKQCVHLASDYQDEFTACPVKSACSYDARFECLAGKSKA